MNRNTGNLLKPFFIWVAANILGSGAAAIVSLLMFSLPFTQNLISTILIVFLPVSFAQWLGLRRIFPASRLWILTIPAGMLLAIFLMRSFPAGLLPNLDDESTAVLAAAYLVMGFTSGLPQWLLLRGHFLTASLWLLASSAGLAAGSGFVFVTGLVESSGILAFIIVVLVYTTATGFVLTRLLTYHDKLSPGLA